MAPAIEQKQSKWIFSSAVCSESNLKITVKLSLQHKYRKKNTSQFSAEQEFKSFTCFGEEDFYF